MRLCIDQEADADLDLLWRQNPAAAARIVAVLQEIAGDLELLEALTRDDYTDYDRFNVCIYGAMQRRRLNVKRLKIFELETGAALPYRVIYAVDWRARAIHILQIQPRARDYESDQESVRRIARAYTRLGIPLLPT
ncbi:MAG: hypothetical protein JWM77_1419 [Rhodospirillales bacterium]|nr:hypothetical protein [Rhodospirillales bacterium]